MDVTIQNAISVYESMERIINYLESNNYWPLDEYSPSNALQLSLFGTVVNLIGCDKVVAPEEVEFINEIFDYDLTVDTFIEFYNENIDKFQNDMLLFLLKLCIQFDVDNEVYLSRIFINALELFLLSAASFDADQDEREVKFINDLITSYRNLVEEEGVVEISNEEEIEKEANDLIDESVDNHTEKQELSMLLDQLNRLTGLETVKKDVMNLVNYLRVQKMREEKGLPVPPVSLHLVFTGNPGTGKTTVARLLAQIYYSLGLLPSDHLVEVDRSGLVAGYVGQTALKVQEVVKKALGGVLFIDEAYTLANGQESDFGREAIDTLLKAMEDNRQNLVVIVAGYPELMNNFLRTNPGLKSRFNKYIHFDNYNAHELLEIFDNMCQDSGYHLTSEAKEYALTIFKSLTNVADEHFGNARAARNLFETCLSNQANLIINIDNISEIDLSTIDVMDLHDSIEIITAK